MKEKSKENGKRAVLYLRFSCSKQHETSIEGQDKVCTTFANQQGYTIIDKYIDRGISASKDVEKRLAFMQMIDDSKLGKFDAIIVYKMDRFSRVIYDSVFYMKVLEKNHVKLLTAIEGGNGDTPEDGLLRSIMIGFSDYYSKELSQKTIRGMSIIASKGMKPGGTRLYGYNVVNKRYVPNPEEGPIVTEIFHRVAGNESIVSIINDLNKRGVTFKGKPFNNYIIDGMLKKETYLGILNFRDIHVENAFEPLVDKSTFLAVQDRTSKMICKGHAKHDYPLAGKLKCGECGQSYIGTSAKHRYRYYMCQNKNKNKGCSAPNIRASYLEGFIFDVFYNLMNKKGMFNDMFDKIVNSVKTELHKNDDKILALSKKIEENNKIIDNFITLCGQTPELAPRFQEEILKIENENAEIQAEIGLYNRELGYDIESNTFDQIKRKISTNFYKEENITKIFRYFVNYLIDEIVIYKDMSLDIKINLNNTLVLLNNKKDIKKANKSEKNLLVFSQKYWFVLTKMVTLTSRCTNKRHKNMPKNKKKIRKFEYEYMRKIEYKNIYEKYNEQKKNGTIMLPISKESLNFLLKVKINKIQIYYETFLFEFNNIKFTNSFILQD